VLKLYWGKSTGCSRALAETSTFFFPWDCRRHRIQCPVCRGVARIHEGSFHRVGNTESGGRYSCRSHARRWLPYPAHRPRASTVPGRSILAGCPILTEASRSRFLEAVHRGRTMKVPHSRPHHCGAINWGNASPRRRRACVMASESAFAYLVQTFFPRQNKLNKVLIQPARRLDVATSHKALCIPVFSVGEEPRLRRWLWCAAHQPCRPLRGRLPWVAVGSFCFRGCVGVWPRNCGLECNQASNSRRS
jgi:hypothetical protein